MNDQRCETCRFWTYDGVGGEDCGTCRRYPPPHDTHEELVIDSSPVTFKSSWCGEWQGKEEKVAVPPEESGVFVRVKDFQAVNYARANLASIQYRKTLYLGVPLEVFTSEELRKIISEHIRNRDLAFDLPRPGSGS